MGASDILRNDTTWFFVSPLPFYSLLEALFLFGVSFFHSVFSFLCSFFRFFTDAYGFYDCSANVAWSLRRINSVGLFCFSWVIDHVWRSLSALLRLSGVCFVLAEIVSIFSLDDSIEGWILWNFVRSLWLRLISNIHEMNTLLWLGAGHPTSTHLELIHMWQFSSRKTHKHRPPATTFVHIDRSFYTKITANCNFGPPSHHSKLGRRQNVRGKRLR